MVSEINILTKKKFVRQYPILSLLTVEVLRKCMVFDKFAMNNNLQN